MTVGRISGFELSPDGRTLVLVADGSGTPQPWLMPLAEPGAARVLPVNGAVQRCVWRPDGNRIVVLVDPDERENNQLIELDPETGAVQGMCVAAGVRHELGVPYSAGSRPFSPDGRLLAYATSARLGDAFDVVVRDLETGAEHTALRAGDGVPADRYLPMLFSPDSRQLLSIRLHQNTEHDLYVSDVDTGNVRLLTPHDGPAKYLPAAWRPEGIYLCTTRDGDHTGLALLDPNSTDGELRWLQTPPHDIEYATVSADGSRLAWSVVADGFSELWHCALRDGVPGPAAPVPGLPRGTVASEFGIDGLAPLISADGRKALVLLGRPGAPTQLWRACLPDGPAGPIGEPGRPVIALPEVVRFTGDGGVSVSGLLYRPSGDGPFPAVLTIHGGPEDQARAVSDTMINRWVGAGIAVLATNIRGSSGNGLRFQRLIYRDWGGGDVEDLRAAAEFLTTVDWIDATRLGVHGPSYGGFAALSCLTRLPEYWRAGVSECGVADLVDDIRAFPPTWRRRAKDWVGDIDDPADLARLTAASPLSHVDNVRAPILLVHGTNDTRADIGSTDRLHAELVRLGKPVDYQRIEGAGHEFNGFDVEAMICDWLTEKLKAD